MPPDSGLAIHIGADLLTSPRHTRWPVVRSCRDTVERTTRLAAAAGITRHHQLLGTSASRARIGHTLREAAAGLDPHGHLLVAFTGHSDREPAGPGQPPGIGWCVHDGTLPLAEVAALLSVVPPTALVTVIADTCYAAALSGFTIPATVILLAACGANQQVLANPAEGFVTRLEQLVLPGGQPSPVAPATAGSTGSSARTPPTWNAPVCGPTASPPGPGGPSTPLADNTSRDRSRQPLLAGPGTHRCRPRADTDGRG